MIPLDIPPGVVHESSKVRNKSNWRETHLIRWDGNTILPMEGWEYNDYPNPAFASPCRVVHKWVTNANLICTAYLCEQHCYADIGDGLVDITPVGGLPKPTGNNRGYGDNEHGDDLWGTPRAGASRLTNNTPAYTLANWGDELRAMTSVDGRLLKWSPLTPATKLVAVTNAPVSNRSFTITPERHIMLFGMGGKQDSFGWCDQENDTVWNFSDPLNKAGFYDIEPSSPIISHQQFFGGVLMFTMQGAYIIKFIGLPYIYNYTEIAKPSAPINAQCITEGPDGIMWASVDGFWLYNGNSVRPISCPLWDFVRDHIDFAGSMFYACVINVASKDELWWCYVDRRDVSLRNTRIVVFEYRRGWWSMGKVARSAGFAFVNDRYPIMSDGLRVLKHEVGYNYPGEEYPWAESFSMNISEGQKMGTLHQMMPEIEGDPLAIQFRLIKNNNRNKPNNETIGPPRQPFDGGNGLIDFRETARDMRLRIEMVKPNPWTIGPMLIDAKQRGSK